MITHYQVFGERCSGTTFLLNAIDRNFKLKTTNKYGHKHFFGFLPLENSDDTFFFVSSEIHTSGCVVGSRQGGRFLDEMKCSKDKFLTSPIDTTFSDGTPILYDRDISTGKMYSNVFELREKKCLYLLKELPQKVQNYYFLRYEDLRDHYHDIIQDIASRFGLEKRYLDSPIRIEQYKNEHRRFKRIEHNCFERKAIMASLNHELESKMGYDLED